MRASIVPPSAVVENRTVDFAQEEPKQAAKGTWATASGSGKTARSAPNSGTTPAAGICPGECHLVSPSGRLSDSRMVYTVVQTCRDNRFVEAAFSDFNLSTVGDYAVTGPISAPRADDHDIEKIETLVGNCVERRRG